MCTPEAKLGVQAFGAGMSAVGAFMGAQAQKSALRSQANIADINARIADGNARNMIYAGTVEESRIKLRGEQVKSQQIAQIAGSGIDIAGSNTAIARLTGTDLITEVDANTARANALRGAWGQRIAAGDERRGAASLRGTAASISPGMAALTSLIGSASSVAQSWYGMSKEGAFSAKSSGLIDQNPDRSASEALELLKSGWPEAGGDWSSGGGGYGKTTTSGLKIGRGY